MLNVRFVSQSHPPKSLEGYSCFLNVVFMTLEVKDKIVNKQAEAEVMSSLSFVKVKLSLK